MVGCDEIEDVMEYSYLRWIMNICQDMDAKISQGIRSGLKVFIMIKDVLKANLFKSIILLAISYVREAWATTKIEEQRWLQHKRLWKDPCWEYCYASIFEVR